MNKRYFWTSGVLSSLTMAFVVSGIMSGYQIGFGSHWFSAWFHGFAISWPTAFILNVTVLPQIRKLANRLSQTTLKYDKESRTG
ncbi:DUF2798 domain-containing protein [Vibrio caribbeanicus]|uniref:DUF2798 domain-containing protein n=1 Tax=Vibrio caribbeanicus TaxID=701175 RepID=UPI002285347D|nr:DUF2798 domain-containing protein [Vibrio caribbeanicus]MCY9844003.1 DUF2798 domain-containing protein [Vibrio caribbeanicus]